MPQPTSGTAPLVSVVVPVYNCATYLEETLASIEAQTLKDFEVICVNDGSTDSSGEILSRAVDQYGNITVLNQQNAGVSAARNNGIAHARGTYVQFVDADDVVDEHLLETVTERAQEVQAQMTIAGFYEYFAKANVRVPRELCPVDSYYQKPFSLADIEGLCTEVTTPNVWRILYSREFLQTTGIRFHEDLAAAEDLAFIYETLLRAERVILVHERLYGYRRDGASSLTHADRGTTGIRALVHIKQFAEQNDLLTPTNTRHLVNLVLDTADYALWSADNRKEYDRVYRAYSKGWRGFAIDHESYIAPRYRPFYEATLNADAEGYLFGLHARERDELEQRTVNSLLEKH